MTRSALCTLPIQLSLGVKNLVRARSRILWLGKQEWDKMRRDRKAIEKVFS